MLIPIALTVMLILIPGGGSFRFCPDGSEYDSRSKCNWPDGILKYEITSSFNQEEGEIIRDAVKELETNLKGCISFRETKRGRRVEITNNGPGACTSGTTSCCAYRGHKWHFYDWNGRDVWSFDGMTQIMNLGKTPFNCLNQSVIQHEFLHALGLEDDEMEFGNWATNPNCCGNSQKDLKQVWRRYRKLGSKCRF